MDGVCLTCGHFTRIERHHVAGERNHPTLTVPVCVPCHNILSEWQQSAGMELNRKIDGTSADAVRALIVGVAHLMQLFAHRHPDRSWITISTAIHASRAYSRLVDLLLPPGRQGRWLPDPTVLPVEVTAVAWPGAAHEAEWAQEFANFALAVCETLGQQPPIALDAMTAIIVDPVWWVDALNRVGRNFATEGPLMRRLIDYTAAIQKFVFLVLDTHLPPDIDERLLDEIWNCLDTSQHLLAELYTQAIQQREQSS
jgi:hypothetical protein